MRFATFSMIGSFVVAVLLMSLWPQNNRFGTPEMAVAQETEASRQSSTIDASSSIPITGKRVSIASLENKKIIDLLKADVDSLDFDETPFQEVVETLREKFSLNIYLDQSAIEDDLHEDTPVSFRISNIRVENALRLMLQEHNATFIPRDGVLRIISQDVASDPEYFVRRIYDVRDLTVKINQTNTLQSAAASIQTTRREILAEQESIHQLSKAIESDDLEQMQKALSQSLASMNSAFKMPTSDEKVTLREQKTNLRAVISQKRARVSQLSRTSSYSAHQELIAVIKTSIAPDCWDDTNGDGTCQILAGLLIVHQAHDVQSGVESLLNDIAHALSDK